MSRPRTGFMLLLALATVACGDDPVGQPADDISRVAPGAAALDRGGGDSGRRFIAMLDDCDPGDPGWAAMGGCALKRGTVSRDEFNAELSSPLSAAVVGHQSWRNQPSYLHIAAGKTVRARNDGGRVHTLTRVANFGGGRVPPLRMGLLPAPECQPGAGAVDVAPGGTIEIAGLAPGSYRFQCCIHSWMRAVIEVQADRHAGHGG